MRTEELLAILASIGEPGPAHAHRLDLGALKELQASLDASAQR